MLADCISRFISRFVGPERFTMHVPVVLITPLQPVLGCKDNLEVLKTAWKTFAEVLEFQMEGYQIFVVTPEVAQRLIQERGVKELKNLVVNSSAVEKCIKELNVAVAHQAMR